MAPSNKISPLPNALKERPVQCRVDTGLYVTFRLSQLLGTAPVKFIRAPNGWRMESAGRHGLIVYFIMVLLAIGSLKTTILNFDYSQEELTGKKQFIGAVTYRGMIFIVLWATCVAVYEAPRRVKAIVECLEELQKVSSQIMCEKPKDSSELQKCLLIAFLFVLKIFSFASYFLALVANNDLTFVSILSWFINYCLTLLLVFMMLQFALPTVEIYKDFNLINGVLEQLLSENYKRSNKLGIPRVRWANTREDTINSLTMMYITVGDVTKKMVNANGFGILLIIIIILTHMIFMTYYIIDQVQGSVNIFLMMPMICWVVMVTAWAVVVIEPCHRTESETGRTSILLCKLSLLHMNEATSAEIQNFVRSVLLNKVVFAPLGICELRRSFITGIVASATSYLIIILQFKTLQ